MASNCKHFPNADDHCLVCEAEDKRSASMTDPKDDGVRLLALADEYEAGLRKMERAGYEEFGDTCENHRLVISALREKATRTAPARCDGEAVAWCQPMDSGKHTPRKFLLYFEDRGRSADAPETLLRGWAKAYRDSPEHRFPSDPHAEFFPVDLEAAAARISELEGALRDLFEHEAFATLEGCDCESCAPVARARALLEPRP